MMKPLLLTLTAWCLLAACATSRLHAAGQDLTDLRPLVTATCGQDPAPGTECDRLVTAYDLATDLYYDALALEGAAERGEATADEARKATDDVVGALARLRAVAGQNDCRDRTRLEKPTTAATHPEARYAGPEPRPPELE